ncbi:MAG TPA: SCO2524 family protein [Natronosporangium sp.]
MRIQPRQHLLDIWRALAGWSAADRSWVFGGRDGRNSIGDAEQLLCLLSPATEIPSFKLDQPDETAQDVLDALESIGDSVELPRRLVRVLIGYLTDYSDEAGAPTYSGGSYFDSAEPGKEPQPEQQRLDVVDSFAMSLRLSLAMIGFARVFRTVLSREDLIEEVNQLERLASIRLTSSIIGLLRSFAVFTFDVNSPEGQILLRMVNQANVPQRQILEELQNSLREVRAGLRDLTIGVEAAEGLDNPNRLFQCGWSWGTIEGAPPVETIEAPTQQPEGVAIAAPYLYFTVIALDAIQELFSERTRVLGLLNDEQLRLARLLQVRWDLTQAYWATLATFGRGRWPLEDLPWQTIDEVESDYYTLLVASIAVTGLAARAAPEAELSRVGRVLEDLAGRGRITRRPTSNDPGVQLQVPGIAVELEGADRVGGPRLSWQCTDFTTQLLKRTLRVASLLTTTEQRVQMLDLSDQIWDHILLRQHKSGPASGLWDQPSQVFPEVKPGPESPSWYFTERVVEGLVAAARLIETDPLRSPRLTELAIDLLAEAEHLFDQELLEVAAEAGPAMGTVLQTARVTLRRAREVLPNRPATAWVLASDVLRELDRLAAARLSFRETR